MSSPPFILYLHGFRSSSASAKAQAFCRWLADKRPEISFVCPDLPPEPRATADVVQAALGRGRGSCLGVVGSSLGGYYAAWACEHYALPAVLINPALFPYRLFEDYLGEHSNLYTGERFRLEPQHLSQLKQLDVSTLSHPERLMIVTQSGDETLEAREALGKYPGAPQWIQPGGSHAFEGFENRLPAILAFLETWN